MVNEWKSDAVITLTDRFHARQFDPFPRSHVRQAISFFGGECFPDTELAVRKILTILLSVGVTELQIGEVDDDTVAGSALALYAATGREIVPWDAQSHWDADPRLIPDLHDFNNLVFPDVSVPAVRKALIIECLRAVKLSLECVTEEAVDIVFEQPDLTNEPTPWPRINLHINQFEPGTRNLHRNIKYRICRLAELGYTVPDEWIHIPLTDGTRFDKENKRLVFDQELIDYYYHRLANDLESRAWKLEHEPDALARYAPNLRSGAEALPPPAVIVDADAARPYESAIANTTAGSFLANAYGEHAAGGIVFGANPAHPVAPSWLVEQVNESHAAAMFAVFSLRLVRKTLPGDEPSLFNGMVNSDSPNIPVLAYRIIWFCEDVKRRFSGERKLKPAAQDNFALVTGNHTVSFGPFSNRASAHDIAYEIADNLAGVCDRGTSVVEEWLAEYHAGDRDLDDFMFAAIDTHLLETALKKEVAAVRQQLGIDAYAEDGAVAQISRGADSDGSLFAANASAGEPVIPAGSSEDAESSEHPALQKGGPTTWVMVHQCLDAVVGGGKEWNDEERRIWAGKYNEEYQNVTGFKKLSVSKLGEIIRGRRKKSRREDD